MALRRRNRGSFPLEDSRMGVGRRSRIGSFSRHGPCRVAFLFRFGPGSNAARGRSAARGSIQQPGPSSARSFAGNSSKGEGPIQQPGSGPTESCAGSSHAPRDTAQHSRSGSAQSFAGGSGRWSIAGRHDGVHPERVERRRQGQFCRFPTKHEQWQQLSIHPVVRGQQCRCRPQSVPRLLPLEGLAERLTQEGQRTMDRLARCGERGR